MIGSALPDNAEVMSSTEIIGPRTFNKWKMGSVRGGLWL